MGFSLTASYQYKYFNEFQLRILFTEWIDSYFPEENPTEIKYNALGIHYFRDEKVFSPYYGVGVGLSNAKLEITDCFDVENKEYIKGIYPFINLTSGVRFNLLDFFYCKLGLEYELSSFYYEANKHYNYPQKQNFIMFFTVGTKIF